MTVSVSVRALKEKRLELSTPNCGMTSACIDTEVERSKVKGQDHIYGYEVCCRRMGVRVDTTARVSNAGILLLLAASSTARVTAAAPFASLFLTSVRPSVVMVDIFVGGQDQLLCEGSGSSGMRGNSGPKAVTKLAQQ